MILDPRLGAHVLCFELSGERGETRWERCRECVRPVRHGGALGCCGSRFPLLLGCCGHEAALGCCGSRFPLLLGCAEATSRRWASAARANRNNAIPSGPHINRPAQRALAAPTRNPAIPIAIKISDQKIFPPPLNRGDPTTG